MTRNLEVHGIDFRLNAERNLANAYSKLGRLDEAIELAVSVVDSKSDRLGAEDLSTLNAKMSLAGLYLKSGDQLAAVDLLEDVVDARKRVLGIGNTSTMQALTGLAVAYDEVGKPRKAIEMNELAYEHLKEKLGAEDARTMNALNNLATVYESAREFELAENSYEQVLRSRIKVLGEENLQTQSSIRGLNTVYLRSKQFDFAKKNAEQWIEILEKGGDTGSRNLARGYTCLAVSLSELGEFETAIESCEKAKQMPLISNIDSARCDSVTGLCLSHLGEIQLAEKLLVESFKKMEDQIEKIPFYFRWYVPVAGERIIHFHQANKNDSKVVAWRNRVKGVQARIDKLRVK